jgi:hypothetical protein
MTAVRPEPRTYRFPPLVRTGLFGTMPLSQVLVLGAGGGLSFVGVLMRLFPWALAPALVAGLVAFKRVRGWPLHELLPLKIACILRRRDRRWFRTIPLVTRDEATHGGLPPAMAGLQLLDVDAGWVAAPGRIAGIGGVHDTVGGVVTGVLRVVGDGQFSLTSAVTQDARIAAWGDALGSFCCERSVVRRVTWQEWSTSTPVAAEQASRPNGNDTNGHAAADYTALLERAAPRAVVHDILVSVSVDVRSASARRSRVTDAVAAALEVLVEELRLFTMRLEAAGLVVEAPLTPAEVTQAVRRRSTPFAENEHAALASSLAARLGIAAGDLAPMAVTSEWDHVVVDRCAHRSWWVESWPRSEVPAGWLDLLLLGVVNTRTVTVVFEPIAPSQSARAIDEDSVALESTESAKSRRGFRVRASERRMRDEVERREHELVAGHGELAYCGLIDVAAPTVEALEDAGADFEQCAARAGVQLRPLEGRHGAGWVAGLPLGRTVATRRSR